MFAVTMGISRTLYGKYGEKLDLMKFMIGSALLCLICYITASLSGIPVIGLLGCIMCGFSVGIMWRIYKHLFGKNTHRRNCNVCTPRHGWWPWRSTRSSYCRKYHPECRRWYAERYARRLRISLILMISLLLLNRARRRNNWSYPAGLCKLQ